MNSLILAAALLAANPAISDGTLVFLQKSNEVVEFYTGSDKTHVGIIFSDAKNRWVYEAAPGKVRRITLPTYLRTIAESNQGRSEAILVFLKSPKRDFSQQDIYQMRHHLDMQLGKPYTIRHLVRGGNSDGFHCAQLVGEGLNESQRFELKNPRKLSPAQLLNLTASQYSPARQVSLAGLGTKRPWCARTWNSWTDFGNWCQWSLGESWNFFSD
jgi:hypothetical protein